MKAYGDKQIPEDIDLEYFGKKTKNRDEIQLEKVQKISHWLLTCSCYNIVNGLHIERG